MKSQEKTDVVWDDVLVKSLLRWMARPMLAAVFAWDGVDALRHPDDHVERFRKMEPTLEKIGLPPMLTSDARLLSRLAGGITAVTALGLAIGKYPRFSAFILAVVNLPITVVNNPVWTARSEKERRETSRGLVVGASLAGGLGMAMLDNKGLPTRRVRRQIFQEAKASLIK